MFVIDCALDGCDHLLTIGDGVSDVAVYMGLGDQCTHGFPALFVRLIGDAVDGVDVQVVRGTWEEDEAHPRLVRYGVSPNDEVACSEAVDDVKREVD